MKRQNTLIFGQIISLFCDRVLPFMYSHDMTPPLEELPEHLMNSTISDWFCLKKKGGNCPCSSPQSDLGKEKNVLNITSDAESNVHHLSDSCSTSSKDFASPLSTCAIASNRFAFNCDILTGIPLPR